jgi:urease accessory protein
MRATAVKPAGEWTGVPAGTITLDYEGRHRRRIAMTSDQGLSFLLDLAETAHLREGDGLVLEDGSMIEVKAKPEELCEIRGKDEEHLLRLAWHIGNRHIEAQIGGGRIVIRPDHVLEDMLLRLGASVKHVRETFDPEGGAYGGAHHGHYHEVPNG